MDGGTNTDAGVGVEGRGRGEREKFPHQHFAPSEESLSAHTE